MEAWYTLHTKPNAEYQVKTALQQRGIQTYLPEIESPKARKGRKYKPFFPCYLFCRVDFEIVGFSDIQWIPGLRRIVAFGGHPVSLPDEAIKLLRHKLSEFEARGEPPSHLFKRGDLVRITEGPFRDMLVIFDGPTTPARRVQVLLDILGQASRLYIPTANLEKASAAEAQTLTSKRPRWTRGRGRQIRRTSWQSL